MLHATCSSYTSTQFNWLHSSCPCAAGAMEPFAKRPRVEGPGAEAVKGEEAVTFHLLSKDPETGAMVLEENGHFPPEMTHQ